MPYLLARLSVVLCLLALPGCVLTPLIQGYKDLGVTESDRIQLLPQHLKKFQDALYWGDPTEALNYVVDESRAQMAPELNKLRKKTMRIVESRIDSVSFGESAREANVKIAMQYYAVPVYIVKERTDAQLWVFEATGGWKLKSSTTIEEANATGAG